MKVDVSKLSAAELDKLAAQIEKRKETITQQNLHKALEDMQAVAVKHGVAFADVIKLYSGSRKNPKAVKGKPKYQNPENAKQTWTGKGRKPGWIVAGLDAGKSLEDFAI
ncbi:H-NS histone family protein [uncultured Roseobacter sp.]|uniref:H-NS histone family protein n=1 Tax=uncultured Roseobacter sp. TaxID=114847 RepID=UPI002620AD7E|nr:H-NS histone family protein [uncultured Roseobacter sp.]